MIREEELREAIAECQGERNPNANTCIKLAAYYSILDHMNPEQTPEVKTVEVRPEYSFADSELSRAFDRDPERTMDLLEELLQTLQLLNPRLYNSFIYKLEGRE